MKRKVVESERRKNGLASLRELVVVFLFPPPPPPTLIAPIHPSIHPSSRIEQDVHIARDIIVDDNESVVQW